MIIFTISSSFHVRMLNIAPKQTRRLLLSVERFYIDEREWTVASPDHYSNDYIRKPKKSPQEKEKDAYIKRQGRFS